LIGSALCAALAQDRIAPTRLVRGEPRAGEVHWDPTAPSDLGELKGFDAVVHLAGENIAEGRWTPTRKAQLRSSRVEATRHLAVSLARLAPPPRALICASAIGWYRTDLSATLDESAPAAGTFLGELVRDWEAAAAPAAEAGIRVVHVRFGVVLSPHGGALAKMLPIFRLGLGGPMGTGQQWVSWISIEDAVGAIRFAMDRDDLSGPINGTAPHPVPQREFALTLGRVLRRPAFMRTPGWAVRLLWGEMAEALLLSGARVMPRRLMAAGYVFAHPSLEPALRALLA